MSLLNRIINNGINLPNVQKGVCLQFLESIADENNFNIYQLKSCIF